MLVFVDLIEGLFCDEVLIVIFEELLRSECGVVLIFDDGMCFVVIDVLLIFQVNGVLVYFFLMIGYVGVMNEWLLQLQSVLVLDMMSWDEVEECFVGGIMIELYIVSYLDLCMLQCEVIEWECEEVDEEIE